MVEVSLVASLRISHLQRTRVRIGKSPRNSGYLLSNHNITAAAFDRRGATHYFKDPGTCHNRSLWVNIPEPGCGCEVATQAKPGPAAGALTRVFFSC
jgi:hypothetical protein